MKFGKYFTYFGRDSREWGLCLVSLDTNPEYSFGLDRNIQKGEVTKFRHAANHLGARYADVLTFDICVVKDPDTLTDQVFSESEYRDILAWFTSPHLPQELVVMNEIGTEEMYYYGLFTAAAPFMVAGRICGITLTFTCSSQFGFTAPDVYTKTPSGSNSSVTFTIDNTSDELEMPLYPIIRINPASTGTVKIGNMTIGKEMAIKVKKDNTVTIDCQNLTVKDTAGVLRFSDLGWSLDDLESIWFPELIYGKNTMIVTGDATFTITCQYPRKVGDIV